MSGQYPPALNLNTHQSPLNRPNPNSFSPASGAPTSYKTNVNRQKTKKWVEAKSVSYEGDDWADEDDEYDEGHEEPQAMPEPPKGLRQKGQTLNTASNRGPVEARKAYGDLGQGGAGQQYGQRAATNPVPAPGLGGKGRTNSFDEGDERRAFSAGTPQQTQALQDSFPNPPGPPQPPLHSFEHSPGSASPKMSATLFPPREKPLPAPISQTPSQPQPGPHGFGPQPHPQQTDSRSVSYSSQPRGRTSTDRTRSIDSNFPIDYRKRNDYSPSAVPRELHTRAASAASGQSTGSDSGAFPPRRSSLTRQESPLVSRNRRPSESSSPSTINTAAAKRADNTTSSPVAKPLPFIRPADIYKRMEEEKERERQSMESGRPSLDSILGRPQGSDHGLGAGATTDRRSTESPSRHLRNRPSWDNGDDTDSSGSRRLKPMLDPVIERKSEYGFEGHNLANVFSGSEASTQVDSSPPNAPVDVQKLTVLPSNFERAAPQPEQEQEPPMLPLVTRFSGFGDGFWEPSTTEAETISSQKAPLEQGPSAVPNTPSVVETPHNIKVHQPETQVQVEHQIQQKPSLGFRSMVDDAFDRPDDSSSIPPTPSSRATSQRSQEGLSVSRKDSSSTSGLSPIMSSMPGGTLHPSRSREEFEARKGSTPAIAEVMEEGEAAHLGPSSSSVKDGQTTIIRKPSPAYNGSTESGPLSQRSGHRRDVSGSSLEDSPARSPAVATSNPPAGEDVVIANATPLHWQPTERGFEETRPSQELTGAMGENADYTGREADMASTVNERPNEHTTTAVAAASTAAQDSFLESRHNSAEVSGTASPLPKVASPTKGKVRDLTDHFETVSRTGSTRSSSSKSLAASGKSQEDLLAPRPAPDRLDSFRPALPGGWNSYSTNQEGSGSEAAALGTNLEEAAPERKMAPTPLQWDDNRAKEFAKQITLAATGDTAALPDTPQEEAPLEDDYEPTPTTSKQQLEGMHEAELNKGPLSQATETVTETASAAANAVAGVLGLNRKEGSSEYDIAESELDQPVESQRDLEDQEDEEAQLAYAIELSNAEDVPDRARDGNLMPPPAKPTPIEQVLAAERSLPPTPPPKDTPLASDTHTDQSEYFTPPVPLKHKKKSEQMGPEPELPPLRPSVLPTISTDYSPQDQESDRLRKEIFKSLSPTTTHAPDIPETRLSPTTPTSAATGRESTLLPSEYDSYWATTSQGDNDDVSRKQSGQASPPVQRDEPKTIPETVVQPSSPIVDTTSRRFELQDPPLTNPVAQPTNEGLQVRPLLKQRFSWEEPVEPVGAVGAVGAVEAPSIHTQSAPRPSAQSSNDSQANTSATSSSGSGSRQALPPLKTNNNNSRALFETSPTTSLDHASAIKVTEGLEVADGTEWRRNFGLEPEPMSATSGPVGSPTLQELPDFSPPASAGATSPQDSGELPNVISPSQPSPLPSNERQIHSPLHSHPVGSQGMQNVASPRQPSSSTMPQILPQMSSQPQPHAAPPASQHGRIPAFREIMALKSPQERIKAFNSARDQFYSIDMGLQSWLTYMATTNPDYLAPTLPHGPTSATATTPVRQQAQQQPYYQQYLAASSASPTSPSHPPHHAPSQSIGGASVKTTSGFGSPLSSSGTVSGRHMQAKGKELLHSAGIFGKKGGDAAKGLLAKGRSKFRSSSGVGGGGE